MTATRRHSILTATVFLIATLIAFAVIYLGVTSGAGSYLLANIVQPPLTFLWNTFANLLQLIDHLI